MAVVGWSVDNKEEEDWGGGGRRQTVHVRDEEDGDADVVEVDIVTMAVHATAMVVGMFKGRRHQQECQRRRR